MIHALAIVIEPKFRVPKDMCLLQEKKQAIKQHKNIVLFHCIRFQTKIYLLETGRSRGGRKEQTGGHQTQAGSSISSIQAPIIVSGVVDASSAAIFTAFTSMSTLSASCI